MVKLVKICFKNFLLYNELTEIDLSKTVLITGANGSGKTCLLKILNNIFNTSELNNLIMEEQKDSYLLLEYLLEENEKNLLKLILYSIKNNNNFEQLLKYYIQSDTQGEDYNCIIKAFTEKMNFHVNDRFKILQYRHANIKYFEQYYEGCGNGNDHISLQIDKIKFNKLNNIADNMEHIQIEPVKQFEDRTISIFNNIKKQMLRSCLNNEHFNVLDFFKKDIVYISQDRGLYWELCKQLYTYNKMMEDINFIRLNKFNIYNIITKFIKEWYSLELIPTEKNLLFENNASEISQLTIDKVPGSLLNILMIIVPLYKQSCTGFKKPLILIDEIEMNMDNDKLIKLYEKLDKKYTSEIILTSHQQQFIFNNISYANLYYVHNNKNMNNKQDVSKLISFENIKTKCINNKLAFNVDENLLKLICSRDKKKICAEGITDKIFIDTFIRKFCKNNSIHCEVIDMKGLNNIENLLNNIQEISEDSNIFFVYDLDNKIKNKTYDRVNNSNKLGFKYDLECHIIQNLFDNNEFMTFMKIPNISFKNLISKYYSAPISKNELHKQIKNSIKNFLYDIFFKYSDNITNLTDSEKKSIEFFDKLVENMLKKNDEFTQKILSFCDINQNINGKN